VLQGDESAVTESDLSKLRQLRKQADELGAVLGTVHEMKALHKKLTRACDSLSSSNSALRDYFSRNEIPYNETEERIMQLYDLAKTFATAPRNLFYLQVPELAEYGAIENISRLHDLQKMHSSIEKELSENLHLDNLPSDKSIRDAARTLKRKKHWYHFFDKERRDSLLLHKDLERSERRTAILVRHSELVKIIKLIEIKEKLSQSPNWNQVHNFSRNIKDIPTRELLELEEWNQKIRVISHDSHAAHLVSTDFNVSKAEKLYVEFTEVLSHIETSGTALDSISSALVNLVSPEKYQTIPDIIDSTTEFAEILNERINWLEKATLPQFSFCEIITSCASAFTRSVLITKIEESSSARKLLGAEYKGISSDAEGINNVLNIGRCTEDHNLTTPIRQMIRSHGLLHTCTTVIKEMEKVATCLDAVLESLSRLSKYGNYVSGEWNNSATNFTLFPESLLMTILSALDEIDQLAPWASYLVVRKIAESNLLLSQFLGLLESKCIPPGILCDSFTYCMYGAIVNQIFEGTAELADFSSLEHEAVRNDFGQKDKNIISHRAQTIAYNSALSANPPAGMPSPRVASCTEMSLLRRLTPQTRMSLRRVLTQANESILALKPCFMMSPHDVAKYLRPAAFKFDVVIMDEASQLKIEETIGSVARANQLVVVGDPQQLPPARHWQNALDDGHGERTDSILSECLGKLSFRPLRWHYRSQHPSLIAFSNHHFYKPNRLILFPSPYERADNLGVHYVYLSDTAYDSNTNQNLLEAQRVVDAAIEHMKSRPQESLGIVTLNAQQRDLIEDLFEKDAANNHPIENYLKKWEDRQEKFFTKNLENVQGDERDAIFISTTFGKPQNSNDVSQNFGPISRDDGDRRLNVLFTRARKSLTLYTSLLPEDIRDNPTTPKGTKILREYLKYAKSGSLRSFYETGRSPESYFEQCVVDILIQNGYSVEPQLGVSEHGYRIDIAVLHPDFPHAYLVAIECDGAKYHSARSARDRDRIRQQVLESLGWKDRIWRIWSTEWFRNPERETKRLIKFIEKQRVLWDPRTAVIEDDGEHTESNGSGV